MSTHSIVCPDPRNCPAGLPDDQHVGGMGGTPVHLPPGGVVVPGHFDHGVPSDAQEADHSIYLGTDGDREYLLTVFDDDSRTICTRDDAHGPWSPPVKLTVPSEPCS